MYIYIVFSSHGKIQSIRQCCWNKGGKYHRDAVQDLRRNHQCMSECPETRDQRDKKSCRSDQADRKRLAAQFSRFFQGAGKTVSETFQSSFESRICSDAKTGDDTMNVSIERSESRNPAAVQKAFLYARQDVQRHAEFHEDIQQKERI